MLRERKPISLLVIFLGTIMFVLQKKTRRIKPYRMGLVCIKCDAFGP
nr:hypothetical protein Q903MT_gene6174 [Picea sitchensis]